MIKKRVKAEKPQSRKSSRSQAKLGHKWRKPDRDCINCCGTGKFLLGQSGPRACHCTIPLHVLESLNFGRGDI